MAPSDGFFFAPRFAAFFLFVFGLALGLIDYKKALLYFRKLTVCGTFRCYFMLSTFKLYPITSPTVVMVPITVTSCSFKKFATMDCCSFVILH